MTSTLNYPGTVGAQPSKRAKKPLTTGRRGPLLQFSVYFGLLVPLLALIVAVPFAWGWGLSWLDVSLFLVFYVISGLGITVAYHRHFTHRAFKANRRLRAALAIAGSTAFQGPLILWVADHRRHHAFADKEGDPHSPWLFGTNPVAIAKGFWHAHMGWNFTRNHTNVDRFAPDLVNDPMIYRISRLFWLWTALSFLLPALIGGLLTWSWWGAFTAFFWAGLVRVCVLHHVTWAVNSICHMLGDRPFTTRDKAANFWPLALISFGESWHNLHHADPTSARHGVRRGQVDISADAIRLLEIFGWAYDVRWPTRRRLRKLATSGEHGN